MIVGICKLDIILSGHHSLKEKRVTIRKIKDSVLSNFKIQISEVGHNDLWQRTELGFAVVGNSKQVINSLIDKIIDHVERKCGGYISGRKYEFINFND